MSDTDTHLGGRLRRLRLERGLSQEQLAAQAGIVQSAISAFESGEKEPRISTLQRLASCLGVSTAMLLEPLEEHPA